MARKFPMCPRCGRTFHIKYVDFQSPFRCPLCDGYSRVVRSHLYAELRVWSTVIIAILLSWALGARGWIAFWITLAICVPLFMIIVFWSMHFSPPKLEACSSPHSGVLGIGHDT